MKHEETMDDLVSKHLIGRHDQKSHAKRGREGHSRSDHKKLKADAKSTYQTATQRSMEHEDKVIAEANRRWDAKDPEQAVEGTDWIARQIMSHDKDLWQEVNRKGREASNLVALRQNLTGKKPARVQKNDDFVARVAQVFPAVLAEVTADYWDENRDAILAQADAAAKKVIRQNAPKGVSKLDELVAKHLEGEHDQKKHGRRDKLNEGMSRAAEAASRKTDFTNEFRTGIGDRKSAEEWGRVFGHHLDAYPGGVDIQTAGHLMDLWRKEIASQDGEVAKALALSNVAANYTENEKQGKITAMVQDLVDLVGPRRVQDGYDKAWGTFTSGGKVDRDEWGRLPDGGALVAPVSGATDRLEALDRWFRKRRTKTGSVRDKLGLVDPNMGMIVGSDGDVEAAYRGNSKGDRFMPFSLRGVFGMRDKHVIRGRNSGSFTSNDLLMSVMSPPRTLTVSSTDGTSQIMFSKSFQNSFSERLSFYRQFRGYQKTLAKQGIDPEANTAGILSVLKEDFPSAFNVASISGAQQLKRTKDDGLSVLDQAVDQLRGNRKLSDEQVFGTEFGQRAKARIDEINHFKDLIGVENLDADAQRKLDREIRQNQKAAELEYLLIQPPSPRQED